MIIELKGVGTLNKGAFLMLLSILDYFKKYHPDKDLIFVSHFGRNFPPNMGKKYGLKPLLKTKKKGIDLEPWLKLIPGNLRKNQNLFLPSDVDLVLDGSGFVYGDQWPIKDIQKILSGEIRRYKKNGTKVILLPQAFGPFKRPEIKNEVKIVVDNADIIFARDSQSLNYLENTFGKKNKIHLAPDFTNILEKAKNFKALESSEVLIIPNIKLLQQTDINESDLENKFKAIIEHIQGKDFPVSFLIHEGKKDEDFAHAINKKLDKNIPVIIEPNALKQKAIISSAYVVITGRFHGLVSSLSQGVPSIALSWSHKYEMLLENYNQRDFLMNLKSDNSQILDSILNEAINKKIREDLKTFAENEKQKTLLMWELIEKEVFI